MSKGTTVPLSPDVQFFSGWQQHMRAYPRLHCSELMSTVLCAEGGTGGATTQSEQEKCGRGGGQQGYTLNQTGAYTRKYPPAHFHSSHGNSHQNRSGLQQRTCARFPRCAHTVPRIVLCCSVGLPHCILSCQMMVLDCTASLARCHPSEGSRVLLCATARGRKSAPACEPQALAASTFALCACCELFVGL